MNSPITWSPPVAADAATRAVGESTSAAHSTLGASRRAASRVIASLSDAVSDDAPAAASQTLQRALERTQRLCRHVLDAARADSRSSSKEIRMKSQLTLSAVIASAFLIALPGCAVTRGQETVGAYVDDSAITANVKAKLVEDKTVDAAAISVETLKGTVMLSGFAKSSAEKTSAERLAYEVKGVKSVHNAIVVRS